MGQVPRELIPLESALDFFGAQLRYWRTLRTLSQVALGQRTHDSGALISKIEKGERFPSLALIRRLDAALTPQVRSRDAALMDRRPQTYRPSLPTPRSTTPLADQQAREDLAALLDQLAADLRSGAATESGLHVKRGRGLRSDLEATPTVRIAVTTAGPAGEHARRLLDGPPRRA